MSKNRIWSYENRLLILLSLIFGFVIFDRMALSFLVPFFDKELGLNNTQIGLLNSLLALAWAISGYLMGTLSDKTGKRKQYLIIAVTLFSICSFLSGIATSFAFLLLARIIMGFSEGPVLPLAQAIMIGASTEKRRGFNMGFLQGFVSNVFAMFAPIMLVALATNYGWRSAFYVAGVPGLVLAILGIAFIKEKRIVGVRETVPKESVVTLLKFRNVRIAILLSCCIMTWLFTQVTFMPKYLIAVKQINEKDMGKIMSTIGLGAIIWGLVIPALSDKFGRRLVVVIFFLLSALFPFSVIYSGKSLGSFLPFILIGTSILGCTPVALATIPSETVPRHYLAQALGLVMGIGELVGGFVAPLLAGWSADQFGLQTPFLIAAGASLFGGLVALFLVETAPRLISGRVML